jgi:hypothetical protein
MGAVYHTSIANATIIHNVNDRLFEQKPKTRVILSEAAQSAAKSKNPFL